MRTGRRATSEPRGSDPTAAPGPRPTVTVPPISSQPPGPRRRMEGVPWVSPSSAGTPGARSALKVKTEPSASAIPRCHPRTAPQVAAGLPATAPLWHPDFEPLIGCGRTGRWHPEVRGYTQPLPDGWGGWGRGGPTLEGSLLTPTPRSHPARRGVRRELLGSAGGRLVPPPQGRARVGCQRPPPPSPPRLGVHGAAPR